MTRTSDVDTGTQRWLIAMHEAAHAVAADEGGLIITKAVLYPRNGGGIVSVKWPRPRTGWGKRSTAEYERIAAAHAVFLLAGPAATALMRWWVPSACSGDVAAARDQLSDTATTLAQARRDADRLVRRRWRRIEDAAIELYHHGRLPGGGW